MSATPAAASPTAPPDEGSSASLDTLRKNLEAAGAGYVEAQNAMEVSKARQAELSVQLTAAEADLGALRGVVGAYAAQCTRTAASARSAPCSEQPAMAASSPRPTR